eukprot:8304980-Ditylum_brightwellii.AAC.1
MLCGNFKLQDEEHEKVHEQPVIPFVPKEESMAELDKVEITLQVSSNTIMGGDAKDNITKNRITKFKMENPE